MGQSGTGSTERYRVAIYGRLAADSELGSIDVEHAFTSRSKAERFALAISHHIPAGSNQYGALAWVLVYAMPDPAQGPYISGSRHCYYAVDHGGVVVKRHAIARGFYGYRAPVATERAA